MNKLKIGIIGAGSIFEQHAQTFKKCNSACEVTMVAKKNLETGIEKIRTIFGDDVSIVDDYHKILNEPEIDAVDIILPHDLHLPVTLAAAKAKKHILIEKVMARNIYECDQMINACDNEGVTLVVCHDRRYHSDFLNLKKILDGGNLGDIFYWKLEHNQNVVFPKDAWVRKKDGIGGGAIMSCLTHQIDCLRWYAGEFDSVSCMTKTIPERMEGEALGVLIGKMKSGALAQLSINWYTSSNITENGLWYELIHVCGTQGEAYYMSGKGTYLKIHDESDKRIFEYELEKTTSTFKKVELEEQIHGHERCIKEWIKYLKGDPCELSTFGTDSRKTVEVAEAAYRSVVNRKVIDIPINPIPWAQAILP